MPNFVETLQNDLAGLKTQIGNLVNSVKNLKGAPDITGSAGKWMRLNDNLDVVDLLNRLGLKKKTDAINTTTGTLNGVSNLHGTKGKLVKFTDDTTGGDSIVSDNGTGVEIAGALNIDTLAASTSAAVAYVAATDPLTKRTAAQVRGDIGAAPAFNLTVNRIPVADSPTTLINSIISQVNGLIGVTEDGTLEGTTDFLDLVNTQASSCTDINTATGLRFDHKRADSGAVFAGGRIASVREGTTGNVALSLQTALAGTLSEKVNISSAGKVTISNGAATESVALVLSNPNVTVGSKVDLQMYSTGNLAAQIQAQSIPGGNVLKIGIQEYPGAIQVDFSYGGTITLANGVVCSSHLTAANSFGLYTRSTAQSLSYAASPADVLLVTTKLADALSEYNASTGIYTALRACKLRISLTVISSTCAWTQGCQWTPAIVVTGGAAGTYFVPNVAQAAATFAMAQTVTIAVPLAAGNTWKTSCFQNANGGAVNTGAIYLSWEEVP